MRVAYTGHEALTFPDYLDLETGKTLYAEPGQVYDIAPASGHVVPGFPVPWFDFADYETQAAALAAEDEAARLAAESAAGEVGGTEEDQHF